MSDPFDIRKEEYLALRKEVENDLKELSDLERNCVIGVATAYAWIATASALHAPLAVTAWMLPILLPIFGSARSYSIGKHLGLIGGYLMGVEAKLLPMQSSETQDGWENYFEKHGSKITTKVRVRFWVGFLLLTIICSGVGVIDAQNTVPKEVLCKLPPM